MAHALGSKISPFPILKRAPSEMDVMISSTCVMSICHQADDWNRSPNIRSFCHILVSENLWLVVAQLDIQSF